MFRIMGSVLVSIRVIGGYPLPLAIVLAGLVQRSLSRVWLGGEAEGSLIVLNNCV